MDRSVLHVDMNSCYASIECLYRPELRGSPVAVGGDAEARHGIILAKNEPAKKCGVKTGEALWQAREKCPGLVIIKPHYDRYLRFSRMARAIYADYSDCIEPFGLDEAWLDVTGSRRGSGESIAQEIRERIKFELGVTVSVGVSWNKIFAKLGSDYKKPDAVTEFTRENYRDIVWPLPAGDLLGIGRSTRGKLCARGIYTIGDIARTDPELLHSWLGKWGYVLHSFAVGEDSSPVMRAGEEAVIKSIGNSTTTPRDLENDRDAATVFYMLAESVAERLRDSGFLCNTVQISLRDNGLFWFERQTGLSQPSCLASELHAAAMKLLKSNYSWQKPLRTIGIRATGLVPENTVFQPTLFCDQASREQQERLERSVDAIRRRYGHYSVCRAACILDKTLDNISPKDEHTIHPVSYF